MIFIPKLFVFNHCWLAKWGLELRPLQTRAGAIVTQFNTGTAGNSDQEEPIRRQSKTVVFPRIQLGRPMDLLFWLAIHLVSCHDLFIYFLASNLYWTNDRENRNMYLLCKSPRNSSKLVDHFLDDHMPQK